MADNTAMLVEMGFDNDRAREALRVCDGHLERAIEYLFSGGGASSNNNNSNNDPPTGGAAAARHTNEYQDVVASISQYSLDQGRSACTCIALTAAQTFLQQMDSSNTNTFTANSILTPAFLEGCIRDGVATYQKLRSVPSSSSSQQVEHLSAEDVLTLGAQNQTFRSLQLALGGIRQGILTASPGSGMGLPDLLTACQQEVMSSSSWLAVLITKTPETVVVLLPPPTSSSTLPYIIIDSHPRPGVVPGDSGAYARIVPSMNDLVAHLTTILPATELGPDIPEMMAMMYNSFDLYPLVYSPPTS